MKYICSTILLLSLVSVTFAENKLLEAAKTLKTALDQFISAAESDGKPKVEAKWRPVQPPAHGGAVCIDAYIYTENANKRYATYCQMMCNAGYEFVDRVHDYEFIS